MKAALPDLDNYIADEFVPIASSLSGFVCDANSGAPLQQQYQSSAGQIDQALAATQRQFASAEWENTAAPVRAEKLEQIAALLNNDEFVHAASVADSLSTGIVIGSTRNLASLASTTFAAAAKFLRSGQLDQKCDGPLGDVEYLKRSWGPALLITPWNGPTIIAAHKIASALAAGSCCILKPSEWAPHSAFLMAKAISKVGLPPGTFQLLFGDYRVGQALTEDPRIASISFTGGLSGGRAIASASAGFFRPLQLELGGNNPVVVFADADLDVAATGIVFGLTNLNAQWCRAIGRVLVAEEVKHLLLQKVMRQLAALRLGSSLEASSEMGPIAHRGQYDLIKLKMRSLQEAGGDLLQATALPDLDGYFIAPTLIDGCQPDDTEEEIFGPVASVHTFASEQEALQLANGTPYGLGAVVYRGDEKQAFNFARQIRTGGVKVNGYSLLSLGAGAPRAAWGWSGLGEEGLSQSIEFFTGARVIGVSPQEQTVSSRQSGSVR